MRNRLTPLLALALLCACHRGGTADDHRLMDTPVVAAHELKEMAAMEWNGPFSSITEPQTRVVTTLPQWEKLWKDIGAPEAPVIDLQIYLAAAVFLGQRNTGGYSVKLLEPLSRAGKVVIPYRETVPRGIVFQAITYPYAVRVYARTGAEISIEAEGKP